MRSSLALASNQRQATPLPETDRRENHQANWPSSFSTSLSKKTVCPEQVVLALKNEEQLTFTPTVHELPQNIYPSVWSQTLRSRQEVWETLTQDNRQRDQMRMQLKIQAEKRKLSECTFGKSRVLGAEGNSDDTFERLYEEAALRRQQKQQQQKQEQRILQEEFKAHQRAGSLSKQNRLNQEKVDLSPLYLRLEQVLQQQAQHRRLAAQQQEVQLKFQPAIDPHSSCLAAKQDRIANIVDRLLDDYKNRESKLLKLKEKQQAIADKQLTFQPVTQTYLHMPSQEKPKRQSEQIQSDYTFHPQINPLSSILTKERERETEHEQIFRLHSAPVLKKASRILELERQKYQECTFNPEINDISRNMARTPQKVHACPAAPKATPTHRPEINVASRSMTVGQRTQSMENIRKKEKEKAEQYRREVQYDQMRQCTFRPTLTDRKQARVSQKACNLSKVAGFQKFWMQAERAQLKERQRKELEDKLFHLQKSYDQRRLREAKRALHQ